MVAHCCGGCVGGFRVFVWKVVLILIIVAMVEEANICLWFKIESRSNILTENKPNDAKCFFKFCKTSGNVTKK